MACVQNTLIAATGCLRRAPTWLRSYTVTPQTYMDTWLPWSARGVKRSLWRLRVLYNTRGNKAVGSETVAVSDAAADALHCVLIDALLSCAGACGVPGNQRACGCRDEAVNACAVTGWAASRPARPLLVRINIETPLLQVQCCGTRCISTTQVDHRCRPHTVPIVSRLPLQL